MADLKRERMTKSSILERIELRMEWMEKEYNFEFNNGYLQVEGHGEERNRKYGEYNMLRELSGSLSDSNLNWIWNK